MREVSAVDIVGKYLTEGGPSDVFDFVRCLPDGERVKTQLRLQLLSCEDDLTALRAAQATAKANGETGDYGDIYKEAQAHEVLLRAVRAVEQHEHTDANKTKYYPQLCVSTPHLRKAFNAAEMAVLLNCYQIVKAKYGPLESLEKEDAETWVARLSDPLRGPFFLSQLDSLHWPGLIVLLAEMCRDLYQAAGLQLPSLEPTSASPPEASTSDIGSSGEQLSVSSTQDPELKVPVGELLTRDQAAELLRKRNENREK